MPTGIILLTTDIFANISGLRTGTPVSEDTFSYNFDYIVTKELYISWMSNFDHEIEN